MIKICFVCLGNICRSPMAEFIMKDLIRKNNLFNDFYITSRATSSEELGNGIYPPVKDLLKEKGIYYDNSKKAEKLKKDDYDKYDYIIGMDESNIRNIKSITDGDKDNKIYLLLDFLDNPKNISDPWYTRDFEKAYNDILEGCKALLNYFEIDN